MPVRSFWKLYVLGAATVCAGSAHASSIVTLEAMSEPLGPSFVVAGAPDAVEDAVVAEDRHMISRSILAFGPPEIAYENVASVGKKPEKPRRGFSPMVLRGGIFGGAFPPASSPQQPVQASVPASARPDPRPAPADSSAAAGDKPGAAPAPEAPVTY